MGTSERWTGASFMGVSAWLYDGASATTTRIGLFDALHTASDGTQESWAGLLTDTGLAAGGSVLFDAAGSLGEDAWVYDSTIGTHYTITLSSRSDGYASSEISFLGEDGLALGTYELFDALDNSLGDRAFAWTASGKWCPSRAPSWYICGNVDGTQRSIVEFAIVGGSGRFAGATGKATAVTEGVALASGSNLTASTGTLTGTASIDH